jgi:uncharacterized caspase-like protein
MRDPRGILKGLLTGALVLLAPYILLQQVSAEPRTALVIGNSAYQRGALPNPVNDAGDMAAALRNAGFDVILKTDANREGMKDAIRRFGDSLKARGGVGMFFYAGHGVQSHGENFLLPVEQSIASESDLKAQAVTAAEVVDAMAAARNGLNIVALDACRDNPVSDSPKSVRGLSRIDSNSSLFVSFSTSPGAVALDGQGRNSPYAKHLVRSIGTPNITLEETFKRTLKGVYQETKGQQTPWISSSFFGDFIFRSAQSGPVAAALPSAPLRAVPQPVTAAAQAAALAGVYRVAGSNPDGSRYTGIVALSPSADQVRFTWWIGSQIFSGVGQFAGRMLVVQWGATHPVVYTFSDDGILDGEWADGSATDKLTAFAAASPGPVPPPQGRYRVEGRNPDGSQYSGSLAISRQGGGYLFNWNVGNSSYRGSGRQDGNIITVNWGSATPIVYALAADGSLRGLWSAGKGEEVATPER